MAPPPGYQSGLTATCGQGVAMYNRILLPSRPESRSPWYAKSFGPRACSCARELHVVASHWFSIGFIPTSCRWWRALFSKGICGEGQAVCDITHRIICKEFLGSHVLAPRTSKELCSAIV